MENARHGEWLIVAERITTADPELSALVFAVHCKSTLAPKCGKLAPIRWSAENAATRHGGDLLAGGWAKTVTLCHGIQGWGTCHNGGMLAGLEVTLHLAHG
jgi:hypothetical protein